MTDEASHFSFRKTANILGLTVVAMPLLFILYRTVYIGLLYKPIPFDVVLLIAFTTGFFTLVIFIKRKNNLGYILLIPYLMVMIAKFVPTSGFLESFSSHSLFDMAVGVLELVFFVLCVIELPLVIMTLTHSIRKGLAEL